MLNTERHHHPIQNVKSRHVVRHLDGQQRASYSPLALAPRVLVARSKTLFALTSSPSHPSSLSLSLSLLPSSNPERKSIGVDGSDGGGSKFLACRWRLTTKSFTPAATLVSLPQVPRVHSPTPSLSLSLFTSDSLPFLSARARETRSIVHFAFSSERRRACARARETFSDCLDPLFPYPPHHPALCVHVHAFVTCIYTYIHLAKRPRIIRDFSSRFSASTAREPWWRRLYFIYRGFGIISSVVRFTFSPGDDV